MKGTVSGGSVTLSGNFNYENKSIILYPAISVSNLFASIEVGIKSPLGDCTAKPWNEELSKFIDVPDLDPITIYSIQ